MTFSSDVEYRGITLPRLETGTVLLLETAHAIYEIELLDPLNQRVRLTATDPRYHTPKCGVIQQAHIGPGMRLEIADRDSIFTTTGLVSARIQGNGWYYDAF